MSVNLILPLKKHQKEVQEFLKACLAAATEMAGTAKVDALPYDRWLQRMYNTMYNRNLDEGFVDATTFLIYANDTLVGFIDVRHRLNAFLAHAGGHIGYMIHPDYRRRGFAKAALSDALSYLKEAHHVKKALITCSPDNEASRNTILALGGKYENTVKDERLGTIERYWITLGK